MQQEQIHIEINGLEAQDLYSDLQFLEVEMDEELSGLFQMRLTIAKDQEGLWRHLDDPRLSAWNKIKIDAGFADGFEPVLSGYITHLRPRFESELGACYLEIWGMDRGVVMDREEKILDWPNQKDSDIANELFRLHGFTPKVKDSKIIHDEAKSTIIQRETDMHFLKRLAARNGYECYVDGDNGYFQPPKLNDPPQPVLAVHFGVETNVLDFALEVNALNPTHVGMHQIDRFEKEITSVAIDSGTQKTLGGAGAAALLRAGIKPAKTFIGMNAVTGQPEMDALCREVYHRADWFVTGSGELNGNNYGHVLKPHGTVTIKGVGETYSGLYRVNHVTHRFTGDGYTQRFQVKRNALSP